MKALRSRNFAKLSSSNSTSDEYCVTSISAVTPAGYCLSQIRSMVLPLWFNSPLLGRDALFWAVLSNAAADGKALTGYRSMVGQIGTVRRARRRLKCVAPPRSFDRTAWLRCSLAQVLPPPWAWQAWQTRRPAFQRLSGQRPAWHSHAGPACRLSVRVWLRPSAQPRYRAFGPRPAISCRAASSAFPSPLRQLRSAPVLT